MQTQFVFEIVETSRVSAYKKHVHSSLRKLQTKEI